MTPPDHKHGHSHDTPDPDGADELIRFGVSMPAGLARDLDRWRTERGYPNRSEAVRDLVRDALVAEQWEPENADPDAEMVGVVTLVYNHAAFQVSDHLLQMQHSHHSVTQATLHIHLSPEHCLEVTVLRGPRTDVTTMAEHLISARGVLHGKFVPTTTGKDLA
jgi:CopG family transcriptional regulator, nickel-responsive regulator